MADNGANDVKPGPAQHANPKQGLPIRARTEAFKALPEDVGLRLDQVLARRISDLSRRQARILLDLGGVFLNGTRTKTAGRLLAKGDEVTAYIGGALARAKKQVGSAAREEDAAALPAFEVLFEDEHLVVVNKPAGLLTTPTPESDRNNLADLLARRSEPRQTIFVVHRIDLQTSGVLVFAKTPLANRVLSEKFVVHDLDRVYRAVVFGAFPGKVTTIDQPVGGKRAVTHVQVEERIGDFATVLRLRLETGRTHQIRLHARALRHPVLGDPDVGRNKMPQAPRMALHAEHLGFVHPVTGEKLVFDAAFPPDLSAWLERLRGWAKSQGLAAGAP